MSNDEGPRVPIDAAYAAAIGVRPAPLGRRALAAAFDLLLVGVLALPLALGAAPGLASAVLAVSAGADPVGLLRSGGLLWPLVWYAIGQGGLWALLLVQALLWGFRGRTAGKAIAGLRAVNVHRLDRPGFWRAVLRGVVLWAAAGIVPLVGAVPFLVSPLWDRERRGRGWLDLLSSSWLVDVRSGLDPFDAKALRLARKRVDAPPPEPDAPLPSLSTSSSGSFANFLPATRSSSGVVAAASDAPVWSPPAIGEPGRPAAVPVAPPSEVAPEAAASERYAPVAVLVFDDGRRVAIRGPRLLGRNPAPDDDAETLALDDPSMQLSKTHAEVGVDAGGFWVLDRHSANGTAVLDASGREVPLEPGIRHPVPWGTSIQLGGLRVRVDAPSVQEPA